MPLRPSSTPEAPLVLRGELLQCIRQAKELGYDAVEIHVIEAPTFPMGEVKAALRETGLHISAIVTGRIFTERGLCITSPDPQNRAAAMAEMRDYIDIAAELEDAIFTYGELMRQAGKITAAAQTGPASGPRPASSTPQTS